jgi:hypothetical protein
MNALNDARKLVMPMHHDVRAEDIDHVHGQTSTSALGFDRTPRKQRCGRLP